MKLPTEKKNSLWVCVWACVACVRVSVHMSSPGFSPSAIPSVELFPCVCLFTEGSRDGDTLLTARSPQPNRHIFLKSLLFIYGNLQRHMGIWVKAGEH